MKKKYEDHFVIRDSKPLQSHEVDDLKMKLCRIAALFGYKSASEYERIYGVYPPDTLVSAILLLSSERLDFFHKNRRETEGKLENLEKRLETLRTKYQLLLFKEEEKNA